MAVASGLLFAVTNVLLRRLHGFSDGTRAVAMLVGSGVFASLLGVVLSAAGMVAWPLPCRWRPYPWWRCGRCCSWYRT
jgi:drug/metabolite transporter (DMT)-like permease